MKWRLCAAVAALSLLLSGCSSLLARSYTSLTPHSATPPAEGDSSILRVENYQELVNALIYLISLGEEEGTVRMYNYDQDVEQSLSNACLEVVQEDPLGAYSVDFIRYDVTPIVSYYLSPRGGERPPAHRGGPAYLPPGAERAPAPPDRPGPARQ